MESRRIPGFSNYRVTKSGDVVNQRGMRLKSYDCNGYRRLSLKPDKGKRQGVDVHRLVAMTWIGPIPKGMWVNHEDGNKANNNVANLRIDTPSYNQLHRFKVLGHKAGNANLLMSRALLVLSDAGFTQAEIASLLDCSQANVSQRLRFARRVNLKN